MAFQNRFVWIPSRRGKESLPAEGVGEEDPIAQIDVSSYGSPPYNLFSPFAHDNSYMIPLPGMEDQCAHSVEGIWQGLKVIDSTADSQLFTAEPQKRKGKPDGHRFGEKLLSYVDARKKIYMPAYVYHVVNNVLGSKDVAPQLIPELEQRLHAGPIALYDVEDNGDVEDPSKPYSHAALLVDVLNVLLNAPLPPFHKNGYASLDDQVAHFTGHYQQAQVKEQWLLREIIAFTYLFAQHGENGERAAINDVKQTFALRTIKSLQLYNQSEVRRRLGRYVPTEKTREDYNALLHRL